MQCKSFLRETEEVVDCAVLDFINRSNSATLRANIRNLKTILRQTLSPEAREGRDGNYWPRHRISVAECMACEQAFKIRRLDLKGT